MKRIRKLLLATGLAFAIYSPGMADDGPVGSCFATILEDAWIYQGELSWWSCWAIGQTVFNQFHQHPTYASLWYQDADGNWQNQLWTW